MKLYPSKWFEELAREKRYQFFEALQHIHQATYLITAHHLDDRIETMLFNMIRWTKLSGLINMTEKSGNILRPLLSVKKSEIYTYLQDNALKYFEDESNSTNEHTRNYIRNQVIPHFENVHPEYQKNIWNILLYFENLQNFIDEEIKKFLWKYSTGEFSLSDFLSLTIFLQKEIIRYIYFISNNNSTIWLSEANIAEIIKFINWKNNKTIKEIHKLKLLKDWNLIIYS